MQTCIIVTYFYIFLHHLGTKNAFSQKPITYKKKWFRDIVIFMGNYLTNFNLIQLFQFTYFDTILSSHYNLLLRDRRLMI